MWLMIQDEAVHLLKTAQNDYDMMLNECRNVQCILNCN